MNQCSRIWRSGSPQLTRQAAESSICIPCPERSASGNGYKDSSDAIVPVLLCLAELYEPNRQKALHFF